MKTKYKSLIVYLIFSTLFFTSNLTHSFECPPSKFVGSWQVYKDDDKRDTKLPHEIMSFWHDGRFCIIGDFPYKGEYKINISSLIFLIKLKDRTITVNREFNLSNNVLKFKNKKIGWVYYKRINRAPMEGCLIKS